MLTVVKIGGSLLGNGTELARMADAIDRRRRDGTAVLVVASALGGVTDRLALAALQAATAPATNGHRAVIDGLRERHETLARELGDGASSYLSPVLAKLDQLLEQISGGSRIDEPLRARLLSYGERLSVPLLTAALRRRGLDARAATAEEVGLRASGPARGGVCDLIATRTAFESLRRELEHRVVVLTGFYGVDDGGRVVLFGRGGTDYSAGAAAAALDASVLELWKDVPGFMTADPRRVPDARLVPELSFDEASKLGTYGARVLHPRCLELLRGRPARVEVRAIDNGKSATRVVERRDGESRVAALALRHGQAVVRLGAAAWRDGVIARALRRLDRAGVRFETFAARRDARLSFTLEDVDRPAVESILGDLAIELGDGVEIQRYPAQLGVVGDGIGADPEIAARVQRRVGALGIRSDAISRDPGDVALRLTVPAADAGRALGALHQEFFRASAAGCSSRR